MSKKKFCPEECGGCSCHLNAPCSHCVDHGTCPDCGLDEEECKCGQPLTHELKCHPEYYQAILDYKKRFEVRKNDRDFQVDDILFLREWDPKTEQYSGRELHTKILYILQYENIEYVCMSIDKPYYITKPVPVVGLKKKTKYYAVGCEYKETSGGSFFKLSFSNSDKDEQIILNLKDLLSNKIKTDEIGDYIEVEE